MDFVRAASSRTWRLSLSRQGNLHIKPNTGDFMWPPQLYEGVLASSRPQHASRAESREPGANAAPLAPGSRIALRASGMTKSGAELKTVAAYALAAQTRACPNRSSSPNTPSSPWPSAVSNLPGSSVRRWRQNGLSPTPIRHCSAGFVLCQSGKDAFFGSSAPKIMLQSPW